MSHREVKKPNHKLHVSLLDSQGNDLLDKQSDELPSRMHTQPVAKLRKGNEVSQFLVRSHVADVQDSDPSQVDEWWALANFLAQTLLEITDEKNLNGLPVMNADVPNEFWFPTENQIKKIIDPIEIPKTQGMGDILPKLKNQALIALIEKPLLHYLKNVNLKFEHFKNQDKKMESKEIHYFEIPLPLRAILSFFEILSEMDPAGEFFKTLGKNFSEKGEILILVNKFVEYRNFLYDKLSENISLFPKPLHQDLLLDNQDSKNDVKSEIGQAREKKIAELEQIIRTLVKCGASIDGCETNSGRETYSHLDEACIDGDDDLACLLLDLKAAGDFRNLGFAINGGCEKALEQILKQGIKITSLENYIDAITHEPWKLNVFKIVFAAEKPAEFSKDWIIEIWHAALQKMNPEIFQALIEVGIMPEYITVAPINHLIRFNQRKFHEPGQDKKHVYGEILENLKKIKKMLEHTPQYQQRLFNPVKSSQVNTVASTQDLILRGLDLFTRGPK